MKDGHIFINDRRIGPDEPPYVICELSGNHNGSLDRALKMVDLAAATGCDAIKIQTYTPDTLTIDCDHDDFRIGSGLWKGRTLFDLYREAHTPFEWHEALFERAKKNGVTLFSTPFDETAADLLDELEAPAFKIASFEANDLGLIRKVARTGKPMIISTGMANMGEIERAVSSARSNGCEDLVLLHCISSYPAPSEQSNLRTLPHLSDAFGVVGGLSDHTLGTATSVAAVALGASVIEKHFTPARADGGPDAAFSLEPAEFKQLCDDCRNAWVSLGKISYNMKPAEEANLVFRRSIYVVEDIEPGEIFSRKNLRSIRPGYGLPPHRLNHVLGKEAKVRIKKGTALKENMVR